MKKFRVKNLTVAVGLKDRLPTCGLDYSCPGGPASVCNFSRGCLGYTINTCHFSGCPQVTLPNCPAVTFDFTNTIACGRFSPIQPTIPGPTPWINRLENVADKVELIDVLKLDLKKALSDIEGLEKELKPSALPETLEDAKLVQEELEGALSEVKKLTKNLK